MAAFCKSLVYFFYVVFSSTRQINEILDKTLDELKDVINYDGASILLMRDETLEIATYKGFL